MKSIAIKSAAVILLTISTLSLSAQPKQRAPRGTERPTAEKIAEVGTDKLDQRLDLTDAQESKIYAINLKYAQAAEANRPEKQATKGERPTREQLEARHEVSRKAKEAQSLEIMNVLTDEQKIEYASLLSHSQKKNAPKKGAAKKCAKKGQCDKNGQCDKKK